ncbi:MAG TPA: M20/M25/M40 family metallo-hydrolase [Candidatus Angelobacter sp.]|nr:M20/M25/M40 family metallo-hydrolase [Candidatus Angelobacter sp.]
MRKSLLFLSSAALVLVFGLSLSAALSTAAEPAAPAEDGTMPALTAIAGQGMMSNEAYNDLEELSDYIGGRVTGSPEAGQAIQWGLQKMRAIGLENVHTEKWQISRGWTRGVAEAEILTPIHHRLSIDSMGWVGSTKEGGAEAEVAPVNINHLEDEMKENSPKWAGKVLMIVKKGDPPKQQGPGSFARFGDFLKKAHEAKAVAIIGGQGGSFATGMHLTHTGGMGFDTYYEIPVVSMIAEDQQKLDRFLDQGKSVRLHINVQNKVSSGPVDTANVVGEIRGSEHPEQVVVVGGHLDSWDLADGATDDGCGVATTLGAAKAIKLSGFKPKRTIRFVLFTGEEQGLLGSLAYTRTHKDEMANHVAAVILDNGQGPVVRLNLGGRDDLVPAVRKFAEAVKGFGELDVDDRTVFGTDAGPFILAGLPGINMGQDSPEYKYTHHSAVDTFDKVKADMMVRDSTMMALTSYWIADRPERLASPWPAEKTAKMLVEKHDDVALKAFGIWPFGDLGKEPAPGQPAAPGGTTK